MPEISLRAYVDYIQDRLERDAFSEVVAQSRHVLETFPKYIEVYKLLARALLEQENYQDATDLFQRVLSADPNDFIAHIGISECYHESGAIDQAIWHLERAFEQVPNNVELQEEIKRLYAERDGSAPRKVQLTAGALARLYTKGKLYPQAILELRKALTGDADRPDLQILLADALWHNHQQVEAAELAASVLKRLPNSIDANRILARLWLHAGQPAEAQPFLDRIAELDPYLAYSLRHEGESAPADAFELSMLEYTAERHATEVGAAEWVSQIRAVEKSETVTGTLEGAAPSVTDVFSFDDAEEPAKDKGGSGGPEIPDWLSGAYSSSLQADKPGEGAGESPAPAERESSLDLDRLFANKPSEPAPSSAPGGEPDWLADVLASPGAGEASSGGGTPSWLDDIIGAPSPSPAPAAPAGEQADTPERSAPGWLQDLLGEEGDQEEAQAEPPAPEAEAEPTTAPETPQPAEQEPTEDADQAPAWLSEALREPAAGVEEPPTAAAGEERPAPDWLNDILSREEAESRGEDAAQAAPVVSTDWLDQIITGGTSESGTPDEAAGSFFAVEAGEAPPDWLGELADEGEETGELVDFGELEPWDSVEGLADDEVDIEPVAPDLPDLPDAGPPADEMDAAEPGGGAEGGPLYTRRLDTVPLAEAGDDDTPAEEELPDWLASPALKARPEAGEPAPDTDDTTEAAPSGGLQPAEDAAGSGPAAQREEQQVTPPTEEPTGDESSQELPDWLVEGDLDNSDDAIAWLEELAAKYDPDFQSDAEAEPGASEGEPAGAEPEEGGLPDWLREEGEEEQPAATSQARTVESPEEQADVTADDVEDFPDWLTGAPSPAARISQEVEEALEDDELPDWLRDEEEDEQPAAAASARTLEDEDALDEWLGQEPARPAAEGAQPTAEADEALDWLTGEPSRKPAAEEDEDELPGWLDEQTAAAAAATPAPAAPEPAPEPEAEEVELPDWLKNMRRSEVEQEDDLDWLYEAAGEQEEEAEAEAEPTAEAEAIPGWLAEEDRAGEEDATLAPRAKLPTAPAGDEVEEAFDWLDKQVEAQGVSPDEPVSQALTADAPPARAPLATAEDEEAEPVSEEEMPEWLKQAEAGGEMTAAAEAPDDELESDLLRAADVEAGDDDLSWLDSALEAEEIVFTDEDFDSVFGGVGEGEGGIEAEPEEIDAPALAAPPVPEPLREEFEAAVEAAEDAAPEPAPAEEAPAITAETGMPDWLASEEEPEEAEEVEAPVMEKVGPPAESPAPEPATVEGDADERLRLAREKLPDRFEEAVPYYEGLVASGEMLEQTVSDITYYLRSNTRPDPRARRILGDAYREQGRLQEALEAYRTALDEL